MSTVTTPISTTRRPRRITGAAIAATVIGLIAAGLLALGAGILAADREKDARGYLSTAAHPFSSSGYAIATENLDIDLDGLGSVLPEDRWGKIRIAATGEQGRPVFVGIARSSDVATFLGGTAHSTVTDISDSPAAATYRTSGGEQRPGRPAAQRFWAASASGMGTQALRWKVRDGDWSVVVMNEDGSRGVATGVSAGASLPFLRSVGFGAIGGGLLLLTGAAAIVYAARRRTV